MIPRNLGELLHNSANRFPQHVAIVFGQKKITYRELDALTDSIARGLIHLGVKRQERVALFLDNCPEFIIGYYAILKAGGVVVPINYMFKTEEVKYILQDSHASTLITSRLNIEMAEELLMRVDTVRHIITTTRGTDKIIDFSRLQKPHQAPLERTPCSPEDMAVILYTSGTTGQPKGAILSHYNLVINAIDSSQAIQIRPRDCFICILPLFHSFAATVCMNLPLLMGAKIVVMKTLRPFKRVIRAIRKNRVTIFVAIPSIYSILKELKLPKLLRTPLMNFFNPVRICISGAAALPSETFKTFEKKFRVPLLEGYGLTEASPVVTLNPLKKKRKPGSIGLPLSSSIELKVIDNHGTVLGAKEIGELIVRGPNVMRGYYQKEKETAETLQNGWLYTGDMATIDEKGYAFIVGRKKEMVNVRGLNVYPREIEEILYQNPKIKEAAVIGIPDPHKGEVPKAFVVLKEKEETTSHEILHSLRERLAGYKIPKYVEFRNSLPKNTAGKILKRILMEEEQKKYAKP
jgi:long-chain acyl-CoA synthetase